MRKQIYRILLKDGTEIVEVSVGKLQTSLKNYIVENNKLETDNWFYLTKPQLVGMITSNIKQPKFNYITSVSRCYLDEVFGDFDVKHRRENGETYSQKYQELRRNKELNKRFSEYKDKKRPMDYSQFRLIC
jgi:hypothetical protein